MDVSALNIMDLEDDQLKPYFMHSTVVFDSSALLEIYNYPLATRHQLYDNVFSLFTNRLWLPSHVMYEYRKNRKHVIEKPIKTYKSLTHPTSNKSDDGYVKKINDSLIEIEKMTRDTVGGQLNALIEFTKNSDKHPFMNAGVHTEFVTAVELFQQNIQSLKSSLSSYIEKIEDFKSQQEVAIKKTLVHDDLEQYIMENFSGGTKFTYKQLLAIAVEGKFRYDEKIPPGYEDQSQKIGLQKYGDLIIWKEILQYAGTNKKDVIFVTNDGKDDWWEFEVKSRKTIPRHELIKEFHDTTDQTVLMYRPDSFYHLAKINLDANITDDSLEVISESQMNNNAHLRSEHIETVLFDWLESETTIQVESMHPVIDNARLRVDFKGLNNVNKVVFGEFKYLVNGTLSKILSSSNRGIEYFKALVSIVDYPIDFIFIYAFRTKNQAIKARTVIQDYLSDNTSVDFINDSLFYVIFGYISEGRFHLEFSDYPELVEK